MSKEKVEHADVIRHLVDAAKEQRFLWLAGVKKDNWNGAWTPLEPRAKTCT